jgi:hypothetical protein
MSATIQFKSGPSATVTGGRWTCAIPQLEAALQTLAKTLHGYFPSEDDRDLALAELAAQTFSAKVTHQEPSFQDDETETDPPDVIY